MKTAAFITLGCKVNQYETEAIREEVLELGYREVPYTERADVYVVNTCSVTATSGVKSRKYVQRVARTNPAARVIVVGCSTPAERDLLATIPQVAVLAGNEEKAMVASFLDGGWKPGEPFSPPARDLLDLSVSRYSGRTRANVKVQDGCNSFCSFCIIPFLRGRSRSRPVDAVVAEVERLAANGFREVVVTGVHLQDYGVELAGAPALAALLRRVGAVRGIERVRLSSVNPRAFTGELLDILAEPPFCAHWHVPLQSGADAVLARMRRDYRVADFARVVAELHRRVARPSIATDVIVGHPGEDDRAFEETLARCREFAFSKVHVFPYSAREGTLAAKLGGHNPAPVVRERATRLRALDDELAGAYRRRFLGETVGVLVEEGGDAPGSAHGAGPAAASAHGWLGGLTDRYVRVWFPAPSARARERFPGSVEPVRLEVAHAHAGGVEGAWAGGIRG